MIRGGAVRRAVPIQVLRVGLTMHCFLCRLELHAALRPPAKGTQAHQPHSTRAPARADARSLQAPTARSAADDARGRVQDARARALEPLARWLAGPIVEAAGSARREDAHATPRKGRPSAVGARARASPAGALRQNEAGGSGAMDCDGLSAQGISAAATRRGPTRAARRSGPCRWEARRAPIHPVGAERSPVAREGGGSGANAARGRRRITCAGSSDDDR